MIDTSLSVIYLVEIETTKSVDINCTVVKFTRQTQSIVRLENLWFGGFDRLSSIDSVPVARYQSPLYHWNNQAISFLEVLVHPLKLI
jgi:hypothetical protein